METVVYIGLGVVTLVVFWKVCLWLVRNGASDSGSWFGGFGGSM